MNLSCKVLFFIIPFLSFQSCGLEAMEMSWSLWVLPQSSAKSSQATHDSVQFCSSNLSSPFFQLLHWYCWRLGRPSRQKGYGKTSTWCFSVFDAVEVSTNRLRVSGHWISSSYLSLHGIFICAAVSDTRWGNPFSRADELETPAMKQRAVDAPRSQPCVSQLTWSVLVHWLFEKSHNVLLEHGSVVATALSPHGFCPCIPSACPTHFPLWVSILLLILPSVPASCSLFH